MRITPYVLAAALVAAGAASPASAAAKRKPITKTYDVTAFPPDPSNAADDDYSVCAMNVPGSFHISAFKALGAGKIKATVTDFVGDWDVLLLDAKGTEIGAGTSSDLGAPGTPKPEIATAKIKKAGTYRVIVCNWGGGPTARATYTFTYS